MRASEQWAEIQRTLPEGWQEARLSFTAEDARSVASAAGVLAPLGPGRAGNTLRFHVTPSGGAAAAESLKNLLERLDRNRIWGELTLSEARAEDSSGTPRNHTTSETQVPTISLVAAWDSELRKLPPDWSDLLCELELDSSDFLARGALLGAPLNPTRNPDALALRFRVGRRGYGTSPVMTRRCFERMDGERITGRISILNALSDVGNVATQGPVWRIAGRAV